MHRQLVAFILGLGYLAVGTRCTLGGSELITVVCGSPTADGASSSIVPVTVSMLNGTADYIDMTYTAVDFNGVSVSCSPSSSRPRVSKTTPHTDNVVVSYTGTPQFPITITASGTGEAPNGDHEQSSEGLVAGNFGRGPHEAGPPRANQVNNVTIVPERLIVQTVPVKLSTTDNNTRTIQTITYLATCKVGNLVVNLHCTPDIEHNLTVKNGLPITHNVSVDYGSLPPGFDEKQIQFTASVSGLSAPLSAQIPFDLSTPSVTAGPVDQISLEVDFARRSVLCKLIVSVDSLDRKITMRYCANEANIPQWDIPCLPAQSSLDPGHSDTVLFEIPTGHSVVFNVWGSAPGIAALGQKKFDPEGNPLP
jgi:hypothetical protein